MIRYTLRCDRGHTFDSWFQSGDAFEKLHAAGMVNCAVCGCTDVQKAIMAPQVRPGRAAEAATAAAQPAETGDKPLSQPASPAEQALAELRKRIESASENVGKDFANEARRIHEGEAPKRSIIGEAAAEDARSLVEDGIPVTPLPWAARGKSN